MNSPYPWLIVMGIAAGCVLIALLQDMYVHIWKQGFEAGKRAEQESWWKCAKEADEAVREMGRKS